MHSAVAVRAMTMRLTFPNFVCQGQIASGNIHSFDIVIVAASGHLKEPAHFADAIFLPMTVDDHIFYAYPHFLSVSERKSRINSFSILNRCSSSSTRSALGERPFLFGSLPAAILR